MKAFVAKILGASQALLDIQILETSSQSRAVKVFCPIFFQIF